MPIAVLTLALAAAGSAWASPGPVSVRYSTPVALRGHARRLAKNAGVTGKPEDLEADRIKVRDYLVKLDNFKGLGGPISFNDDGDAIKAFYVLQGQNGAWATKVQGCSSVPGHPAC